MQCHTIIGCYCALNLHGPGFCRVHAYAVMHACTPIHTRMQRVQFLVARELFRIAYLAQKSKRSMPLMRTQQWFFFCTTVFWLYGR